MARLPFSARPVFNHTRQALLPTLALALGCCLLPATQADELYELAREDRLTLRALIAYGKLPTDSLASLSELRSQGIDILSAGPAQLSQYLNDAGLKLNQPQRQAMIEALTLMQEASIPHPARLDTFVEVLPVAPAALSPLPPLRLPAPLPLMEIGSSQYTGMISMAMEATLRLMGNLDAAEMAQFDSDWAGYFDFPSEEIIDYFRTAVPILTELVQVQAAVALTASAFDDSWEEAEEALAYDNTSMALAAMQQAELLQHYLNSLAARGNQLAEALSALGERPDAQAVKDAQADWHRRSFNELAGLRSRNDGIEGIWQGSNHIGQIAHHSHNYELPLLFVVYAVDNSPNPEYRTLSLEPDMINSDQLPELATVDGLYELGNADFSDYRQGVAAMGYDAKGAAAWISVLPDEPESGNPRTALLPHLDEGRLDYSYEETGAAYGQDVTLFKSSFHASLLDKNSKPTLPDLQRARAAEQRLTQITSDYNQPLLNLQALQKSPALGKPGSVEVYEQALEHINASMQSINPFHLIYFGLAQAEITRLQMHLALTPAFVSTARQWLQERPFSAKTSAEEDRDAFFARLRKNAGSLPELSRVALPGILDEDSTEAKSAQAFASTVNELAEEKAAALAAAEAEAERRRERIEFHNNNIRFVNESIRRTRAALSSESDSSKRAALQYELIGLQTDQQIEKDLIASIQTGTQVRSRTAFDDYARDRLIDSIRENQQRMQQFKRITDTLNKLASRLPAGEDEHARDFIQRQLSPGVREKFDVETVQRMASALHKKVEGHQMTELARAMEDEAWANLGLSVATNIKTGTDVAASMVSMTGTPGMLFEAAYQGVTGYITEGDPTEAALRCVGSFNAKAAAAAEAYRGYREGGMQEAMLRGSASLAMSKVIEIGAGRILARKGAAATHAGSSGKQPASVGKTAVQPVGKAPSAAVNQNKLDFDKARREGRELVDSMRKAQNKLSDAASKGRPATELKQLQDEVRKRATAINNNPSAKNILKYQGDTQTQRLYNLHMEGVHFDVEKQFHANMQAKGWNRQGLVEFRNASSAGSVGMDFDIGLDEKAMRSLTQNGKTSSVYAWQQDAQKAWDEAYQQVTGFNAQRAWENVTSSAHAESYKDLAILGKARLNELHKGLAEQTADVTRYKSWHMMQETGITHYERLQEISRGAAKDYKTKLAPLLEQLKTGKASEAHLLKTRDHWQTLGQALEDFGTGKLDPITAERQISLMTGGKSIPDVVEQMSYLLESTIKFGAGR